MRMNSRGDLQTGLEAGDGRRGGGRRSGQSFVEFTLVAPMLLVIMTGMVSFGLAIWSGLRLENGVIQAAQLMAISRGQTTDPCATGYNAITNAAPNLSTGLSATFVINGTTYAATNTCTSGTANMVQGQSVRITATYPCTIAVPWLTVPSCQLKSQVTEVIQ